MWGGAVASCRERSRSDAAVSSVGFVALCGVLRTQLPRNRVTGPCVWGQGAEARVVVVVVVWGAQEARGRSV